MEYLLSFSITMTPKLENFGKGSVCRGSPVQKVLKSIGVCMDRGSGEGAGGACPSPLQYLCGGHPCYWPLLENAKPSSSLAVHLGHDWKLLKLLQIKCQFLRLKCTKSFVSWGSAPKPCVHSEYFVYFYILCNWPLAPYYKIIPRPIWALGV